jgi:hypothetical protein
MATDSFGHRTLSTGQTVSLPLDLSCTFGGTIVPARRGRLDAHLPPSLSPVAIAPAIGCVALVGIRYHRVGDDSGIDPYDEFAVIVPAVSGSRTRLPLAELFDGETGGYVHWLPVTTDAAVALGRELWGYPKELAQIAVTDAPRAVRTVVRDGDSSGERVRLEVSRPRIGVPLAGLTVWSYTSREGSVIRARMRLRGELSIGSPVGTRLELASELASELGLWRRPLLSLVGSRARATLGAGEPIP